MNLRERIAAAITTPPPPAIIYTDDPADGLDGHTGSEPFALTPGASFDAGTLIDQSQTPDAGGWPDDQLGHVPPTDHALHKAPAPIPPVHRARQWVAETVTFAAGDTTPRLVTPSGIDTRQIIAVTLNGHVDGFLLGPEQNAARVGFLLPINRPVRLEVGPLWAVAPAAGGQLAVAVEYWSDPDE